MDHFFASTDANRWDQQTSAGETMRQFHKYKHYENLPPHARGVSAAWRAHKRDCEHAPVAADKQAPKSWWRLHRHWGWSERAGAQDANVERAVREKLIADQIEARQRHARAAQALLAIVSGATRAFLDAFREPTTLLRLTERVKAGELSALITLTQLAQVVPGLVNVERLALGMATEAVEVDDKRESDASFADRIVQDPGATALAIELLHRLSSSETVQ